MAIATVDDSTSMLDTRYARRAPPSNGRPAILREDPVPGAPKPYRRPTPRRLPNALRRRGPALPDLMSVPSTVVGADVHGVGSGARPDGRGSMRSIFCPGCGLEQPTRHRFCIACGEHLPVQLLGGGKRAQWFAGVKVHQADPEPSFLR